MDFSAKRLTQGFLLAVILLVWIGNATASQARDILILSSSNSNIYQNVTRSIEQTYKQLCNKTARIECSKFSVTKLDPEALESDDLYKLNPALIVTLGKSSAKKLNSIDTTIPRYHALVSKSAYENDLRDTQQTNQSAILLDQPLYRQFYLARLIKNSPKIGILLGPTTLFRTTELNDTARQADIELNTVNVPNTKNLGPSLKNLMRTSNIILALPDPGIYNKKTIFNILLSSYHNDIPVIGFSAAYVKAGALIAAYSNPEQIGKHIGEIVHAFANNNGKLLQQPVEAKYFSISVNNSVAKSLGISLPEQDKIIEMIKQAEQ